MGVHCGMIRCIKLLGMCLREYRHTCRIILYIDVLKSHICPAVLRAAFGSEPLHLCGPCQYDMGVAALRFQLFAPYKHMLREEFQRKSALTATSEISWELILETLWHVISVLLQGRDWSQAFAAVGILNGQRHLSKHTESKLMYEQSPALVTSSLPHWPISKSFSKRVCRSRFTSCSSPLRGSCED